MQNPEKPEKLSIRRIGVRVRPCAASAGLMLVAHCRTCLYMDRPKEKADGISVIDRNSSSVTNDTLGGNARVTTASRHVYRSMRHEDDVFVWREAVDACGHRVPVSLEEVYHMRDVEVGALMWCPESPKSGLKEVDVLTPVARGTCNDDRHASFKHLHHFLPIWFVLHIHMILPVIPSVPHIAEIIHDVSETKMNNGRSFRR